MSAVDRAAAAELLAIGDTISPEHARRTAELYRDRKRVTPELAVTRDAAYGPHERHRLDVFTADPVGEACPVVVFVHGGNFVGGQKATPDGPFYDNVGAWAVDLGLVGVTVNYRLAPEHRYPAGREDLAAALDWVRARARAHGGDPERIVLMGASAGATHVADLIATGGPPIAGVAGAMLLSGMYDLAGFPDAALLRRYYGPDADLAALAPLAGLAASDIPLLVTVSEWDPPSHHRQARALVDAVVDTRGRWPHLAYLPHHNHFSPVLHLGTADQSLTPHVDAFLSGHH